MLLVTCRALSLKSVFAFHCGGSYEASWSQSELSVMMRVVICYCPRCQRSEAEGLGLENCHHSSSVAQVLPHSES